MKTKSRRRFLCQAGTGLALGGLALTAGGQETNGTKGQEKKGAPRPSRPRLEADLVHRFVLEAHRNLDQVREMLQEQPALVNATWDWGGGDWETALGGAAHMGRRDIALFLLERGARLDVFAAAMLGKIEVVRAALAVFPEIVHVPGPHGIPLLAHARAGGRDAEPVLRLLQTLPRRRTESSIGVHGSALQA